MRSKQEYVGIDLHRKYMSVVVMDEGGGVRLTQKISNSDINSLQEVFTEGVEYRAIAESTYGWYWLADVIDELPNASLKLAHAKKVKALTRGKKTDKIDAKLLANLERVDLLPESHKSSQLSRELKELLRYRGMVVKKRADMKHKIRDVIAKNNLHPQITDICGKKGREWLEENVTKYPYKQQVRSLLKLIDATSVEIEEMDNELKPYAKGLEQVELLKTIPGIGDIAALSLLAEIDDISRFPSPDKLCAYAGLVPTVSSSGGKTYMGRTRKGNRYIKPMLAQAVIHAVRKDEWLKTKYEQLKETKNTGKARLAIMRKLMVSVYYVLSREEAYKYREIDITRLQGSQARDKT